jgi:hypothetical protein
MSDQTKRRARSAGFASLTTGQADRRSSLDGRLGSLLHVFRPLTGLRRSPASCLACNSARTRFASTPSRHAPAVAQTIGRNASGVRAPPCHSVERRCLACGLVERADPSANAVIVAAAAIRKARASRSIVPTFFVIVSPLRRFAPMAEGSCERDTEAARSFVALGGSHR